VDAAAQILGAASGVTDGLCLQSAIRRIRVYCRPGREIWGHARLRSSASGPALTADLQLIDEHGVVIAEVTGLESRPVDSDSLAGNKRSAGAVEFYEPRWLPSPRSGKLPSPLAIATQLLPLMSRALVQPELVEYGAALAVIESLPAHYVAHAFNSL